MENRHDFNILYREKGKFNYNITRFRISVTNDFVSSGCNIYALLPLKMNT